MEPHGYMLAFLGNLGPWELIVIGIVALLLFGKRLPEVGRSLGRGIVEFKKGLRDTGDEINTAGSASGSDAARAAKPMDKPSE